MNENRRPPVLYGQYPCNLPFKSLKEFLKRLDQTMRWEEWLCAGKQLFPGVSLDDYQFENILRAYILGKVLCLNIQDLPEAISDSIALREFMGSKDAYQVSIDKNLLTSFHERIHTTGLDELIDNEISFLVRLHPHSQCQQRRIQLILSATQLVSFLPAKQDFLTRVKISPKTSLHSPKKSSPHM